MNTPNLLAVLVGSNAACLFLGYLFGRLTRATVRIEENMDADPDATTPDPPARRLTPLRALGLVVVAIGVATIALGVMVTVKQAEAEARDDRLTACITGYSNALADAFRERASATSDASEAVDTVMAAIGMAFVDAPAVGRDRVLAAIQAYNEARAEAKKTQAENPLPDAPRDACAELMEE